MSQSALKRDMLKCPVFLFKISQESKKEQESRLFIANSFQRRTLLRVLRKIASGEIPMTSEAYTVLKAKKKSTALSRLDDKGAFLAILKGSKTEQIETLKKFLPVLKHLLHTLFYRV